MTGRKRIWNDNAERMRASRAKNTVVIVFDGEGYDNGSEHVYTLLCAGNEDVFHYVHNPLGLRTEQCLDFIIAIKEKYPQSVFISFAFNYDITHILYDFSREDLELLNRGKTLSHKKYAVALRYGKRLWVKHGGVSAQINDIFGFCQTSLLKSLENWQIDVSHEEYVKIKQGKEQRGTAFELEETLTYTKLELKYTCKLFDKIRESVRNAVEKPLTAYNGAGSVAATILSKHISKEQRRKWQAYNEEPEVKAMVYGAYFGGRIEQIQFGFHQAKIHNYDINSAYPSVIADMHSLDRYKIIEEKDAYTYLAKNKPEIGIAKALWHFPEATVYPFPYRFGGRVYFPQRGNGYVHLPELYAAMAIYGASIRRYVTIEKLLVFFGKERPFDFIRDYYDKRRVLKEQGKTGEQLALKLGLNSIYGKMAQRYDEDEEEVPVCVNMVYAGHITATTRAALYKLAVSFPKQIISINTDGVYSTEKLPLSTTNILGGYSYEGYEAGLFVYSGLYFLFDENGDIEAKTRGIDLRKVSKDELFADVLEGYKKNAVSVEIPQTRFIGFRRASMSDEQFKQRGRFIDEIREIKLYPTEKRSPLDIDISNASTRLLRTNAVTYDFFYELPSELPRNLEYEDVIAEHEDNQDYA